MSYLVVGGSDGIGAAIVRELYGHGDDEVFAVGRSEEKLAKLKTEMPNLQTITGDVGNVEDVIKSFEIARQASPIRIVVETPSIYIYKVPTHEFPDELWHEVRRVNYDGAFFVLREAMKEFMKEKAGTLLTLSSFGGLRELIWSGRISYNPSKAAQVAMMIDADGVLRQHNSRAYAICPALVDTGLSKDWQHDNPEHADEGLSPEELAKMLKPIMVDPISHPHRVYLASKAGGLQPDPLTAYSG